MFELGWVYQKLLAAGCTNLDLQTTQNAALRTATGCLAITKPDHLHCWETQITKVQPHNILYWRNNI